MLFWKCVDFLEDEPALLRGINVIIHTYGEHYHPYKLFL